MDADDAIQPIATQGNEVDQSDMKQMGKKQELRREFHFFSIWGYSVIVACSWEFSLINGVLSLQNGGTAGSNWMALTAIFGMSFVTLSMAEMASIAPTAGGQYHWCSEFAPKSLQKVLSYYAGWFCVLGWQSNLDGTAFAAAQQIDAIVVIAYSGHKIEGWQTALISWAIIALAFLCNSVIFRKLPLIEGLLFILHVFGFLAFIVVLWVMAPRGGIETITTFQSNGWPSLGLSALIGLNAATANNLGADSGVHLGEELHNASWALPRSMIAAAAMNYTVSFTMIITLMFCLGSYADAIGSATGQPYVEVLFNATHSRAGTIGLTSVVLVMTSASTVNSLATISRQLWSFARDGATAFSGFLARVHPRLSIPINAILASIGISVVLTSISIGSTAAYGIFLSLSVSGLLTSYVTCIACVLHRRTMGERLPEARFSLGRAGRPVNVIALLFLSLALVFQFFPYAPNPDAKDMNWSVVIYVACCCFITIFYWLHARHHYEGPVVNVKRTMVQINGLK